MVSWPDFLELKSETIILEISYCTILLNYAVKLAGALSSTWSSDTAVMYSLYQILHFTNIFEIKIHLFVIHIYDVSPG